MAARTRKPRSKSTGSSSTGKPEKMSTQMKRRARRIGKKRKPANVLFRPEDFLSTGSTMLNLSISDHVDGGWPLGKINTLPGKSQGGKTLAALHALCEASIDQRFDDYDLIHDDTERRQEFNIKKLFPPLYDRLISPTGVPYKDFRKVDPDELGMTNTIQQLQARSLLALKKGKKFIWIVDSLDAITSDEEIKKELKKAGLLEQGKEDKTGSYHMEKAKYIHKLLRNIDEGMADNRCLMIITQQLRQKINPAFGEKHWYTVGGEGPYFYSHVRPFLTGRGRIKENGLAIGNHVEAIMDKNSVTGKYRDVEFDIYYDMGIDDVGSMVDFLLKEKTWKSSSGGWVRIPEWGIKVQGRDQLTRAIEAKNLEPELKKLVQKKWDEREASVELNRKPRY